MPTVRLDFTPAPAHVRTARLVAVAVARRAGVAEELLDEIRLAVGEACSRAVALHQMYQRSELVDVRMSDRPRFTVWVRDRGPGDDALADGVAADPVDLVAGGGRVADPLAEPAVSVGMGLALLTGLVDDLTVTSRDDGPGTTVRMSWQL